MKSCCDEYCSTHGCNQGRDCPVRKCRYCHGIGYDASGYACTCTEPAKVAKARPVLQDRELLPPSVWRAQLRVLAKWVLLAVGMLLCAALLGTVAACSEQRTYDCSMASFHPDFPKKLKEECRKRFST